MRLGIGLAALGRPAYINLGPDRVLPVGRNRDELQEASWRVLDAAYAAGIRWVDVARSYGLAEDYLAGWLAARGVADLAVSSKWGYAYVGGWRTDADVHEVKDHSLIQFTAQWRQSWAVLGERIALYQVHSLTPDSPVFGDRRLLEALAGLTAQGVRVGFSASGPAQAEVVDRALELRVYGEAVFTAVQATWNVLEPSVGPALERARSSGAHVLIKESLANGRLAAQPPDLLAEMAQRHGVGPDAVAIAAALAQPWADTVLLGPVTPGQLSSNLDALTVHLSGDDLRGLAALAETPVGYWAERSALAWR